MRSGAIFRTKLVIIKKSHGGATERKNAYLQVAPSSGQNWLSSSSSHGGATERCQVFKWRHLPDKTWLSSSSSHGGATERSQVFKWRHLPDKTGYHHHHMVAPLSGARYSSGAIFRTKLVIIRWWRTSSGRRKRHIIILTGGATERCQVFKWRHLPEGKKGYHHQGDHMVAPLSGARYSSGAIFRTEKTARREAHRDSEKTHEWSHTRRETQDS